MANPKFHTLERLITLLPGLPDDTRRGLVEILCESGLKTIARLVDSVGDSQHPVDIAAAMVDVALKAGQAEILNEALAKVDISWPTEIVVAF